MAIWLHWLWNIFQFFALRMLPSPIQSSYLHRVGFSFQWPRTSSKIWMPSIKSPSRKPIEWNFWTAYRSSLNFIRRPNSWVEISILFFSIFRTIFSHFKSDSSANFRPSISSYYWFFLFGVTCVYVFQCYCSKWKLLSILLILMLSKKAFIMKKYWFFTIVRGILVAAHHKSNGFDIFNFRDALLVWIHFVFLWVWSESQRCLWKYSWHD